MPKRNYKKKSKKRGGASGILRISRPNSRRSENERPRTQRVVSIVEPLNSNRSPTRNRNPPLRSSSRTSRPRFSLFSSRTRKSNKGSTKKKHNP